MSNLSTFLGGSLPKAQAFTSNGTFTKPSNVSWVTALLVGGGGGGYTYYSAACPNPCSPTPATLVPYYSSGGAGGETKLIPLYLTTCSTIAIGTGGVGQNVNIAPTVSTAGGNTTATGATPVTATAYGGGRGTQSTGSKGGGTGGGGVGSIYSGILTPYSTPYQPYLLVYPPSNFSTSPQTQNGQSSGFGVGGGGGSWTYGPYYYNYSPSVGYQTTTTSFPAGNALGLGSPTGGGGSFGAGGATANTGGGGNVGSAGGTGYAIIYYMG